jgi:hypothetical protein
MSQFLKVKDLFTILLSFNSLMDSKNLSIFSVSKGYFKPNIPYVKTTGSSKLKY